MSGKTRAARGLQSPKTGRPGRINPGWELLHALALAGWLAGAPPTLAAEPPDAVQGRAIMREAFASLRPQPSMDETPLDLTYLGIHYRIPRNYVVSLSDWNGPEQHYIGLRVNIPDLKPFEVATAACFLVRPSDRPPGCEPLEFRIQGIDPPDADQAFRNLQDSFTNQVSASNPFGMELYESGPNIAHEHLYRTTTSDGHFLYLCQLSIDGLRHAICSVVSDKTKHGPHLNYFFPARYLFIISAIDERIRHLVDGFVVKQEDSPK